MIEKKFIKPRALIFCKDRLNHKERLIYNYLLLRLKQDKQIILKEKKDVENLGYEYKGHNLKVGIKELKEHLKLTKKADIINMFHNLRSIDLEEHKLTDCNIGRKNKSTFTAKLIGDIKEYNSKEEYFELTFSPLIVKLVVFDVNDYVEFLLEDLVKFKSKYSLIIYEILKASYIPHFNNNQPLKMSLEDFKSLLNIENYNISNLKQRVLKKAKEDIESLTNYKIKYDFLSGDIGKRFKFIEFSFDIEKSQKKDSYIENKKVKNLTQKELVYLLKNKMAENLYIEQINKENKELRKALNIEKRKSEMAIDELDKNYQNSQSFDIDFIECDNYESDNSELCF